MQLVVASLTCLLLVQAARASIAAPEKADPPSNFNCKLDDNECMKNYLQNNIFARFNKGFPEFGVKPFDPLHFDDLSFDYEVGPGVKITLNHNGAILYGLSKTKVSDLRAQVIGSHFSVEAHSSIPELLYEGSYTCKGEFLFFPVDWSGKFNMSLGDVTNTVRLTANIVTKADGNFLDLQDLSFDFNVNAFNTYASGLFWDFKEIEKFALTMTNKYWRGFIDVMWKLAKPDVLNTASDAITTILSKTPVKSWSSSQSSFVSNMEPFAN